MDLKEIEGLVKIIENSSINEFTLKEGNLKITMSKLDHSTAVSSGVPMSAVPTAAPAENENAPEEVREDALFITSPIVGTFYSAPTPDAPAFVKEGDQVKNGQTVCIIEAMKLMNEIQSEFDCEIEAVLVRNEQKVEYGQPLFRVKKL